MKKYIGEFLTKPVNRGGFLSHDLQIFSQPN